MKSTTNHFALLLLGSNLGNRKKILENSANLIQSEIGVIGTSSCMYETSAWGIEAQPAFLNQVVWINTHLNPEEILQLINKIEKKLGRVRHQKWGERLIDIDILYYDYQVINSKNLIIPHPEIANRRFTLVPLVELAADLVHPVLHKTQRELLENCTDMLMVKKYAPS